MARDYGGSREAVDQVTCLERPPGEMGALERPWAQDHSDSTGATRPEPVNAAVESTGLIKLARTIECEIIPRLVIAHRDQRGAARASETPAHATFDVAQFAKLALAADGAAADQHIEGLIASGVEIETVFLDLLAPAARHLGDRWTEDTLDFAQVMLGLGRLQQILRTLAPRFGGGVACAAPARRALLIPAIGERHCFGLVLVGEFFVRAGWDVAGGPGYAAEQSLEIVRREWFDLVGLSLGSDRGLDTLAEQIRALRRQSRNGALIVLVGGPVFLARPDEVDRVGADGTAADAREAATLANIMVEGVAGRA